MDISLEQYRVFYQVSRHGSITAAAKALCVSQPAVSQSLQHLEEALGCELFVRTPKGVRLTQAGELLDHYVSRGLDQIMAGEAIVRKNEQPGRGRSAYWGQRYDTAVFPAALSGKIS